MPHTPESGPERIPTKEEVLEVMGRYIENFTVNRELSDERGLYHLELKVEGENEGEYSEYYYTRKGRYPGNVAASKTGINVVDYEDGMPVGGREIAELNSGGEWQEVV